MIIILVFLSGRCKRFGSPSLQLKYSTVQRFCQLNLWYKAIQERSRVFMPISLSIFEKSWKDREAFHEENMPGSSNIMNNAIYSELKWKYGGFACKLIPEKRGKVIKHDLI